ncbi:diacylglycerol/lipid kinase family protein [Nannocystaceae bacterium ST9]
MSEHVVAIVNPRASNGACGRRWPKLEPELRKHWPEVEVWLTEAPRHATVLARTALERGASLVIGVGGDGTNNEVLGGFVDPETGRNDFPEAALGIVAAGTGGDFQRMFGPLDAAAQIVRLAGAPVRTIDYGLARFTDDEGRPRMRPFLNIASVGVSGVVVRNVSASRRPFGPTLAYVDGALRAIASWRNVPVRVRIDDGPARELALTLLCIGNGQYFGGGMWACPSAGLESGKLEALLCDDLTRMALVGALARSFRGRHVGRPGITSQAVSTIEIEPIGDVEVLIDVDGEQPGRLPARFEVFPQALRVRVA